MKPHYILVSLFLLVLLASLFPVFDVSHTVGGVWEGIHPSYSDDAYYYTRMREILDGHIWAGNSYFIEHQNELPPAFIVPDLISVLPMVLGIHFVWGLLFNFIFWSLVGTFLFYLLGKALGVPSKWSALGAFIVYLSAYFLIIRPVSMQVIFPLFTIFLICIFKWISKPHKRSTEYALAVTGALTFYMYAYLWQIAVVVCALLFMFLWFERRALLFAYLRIVGIMFLLALPAIFFTFRQTQNPFFWETMARTGLVYTHLPTGEVLVLGIWVLLFVLFVLNIKKRDDTHYFNLKILALLGVAMLVVSGSNIITGRDLELAPHVGRFIRLWFVIASLYTFFVWRTLPKSPTPFRIQGAIYFLTACMLVGVVQNFVPFKIFVRTESDKVMLRDAQGYGAPLSWLETHVATSTVILFSTKTKFNEYLPIYTKHYVAFADAGILNLLGTAEVEERYLLSKRLEDPKYDDIAKDIKMYAGAGAAFHDANTENKRVRLCKLLLMKTCGSYTTTSLLHKEIIDRVYTSYVERVKPWYLQELHKYRVEYVLFDAVNDIHFDLSPISKNIDQVYADGRFKIYKLR